MFKKLGDFISLKEFLTISIVYILIVVGMVFILLSIPNKYQARGTYAPAEDMQSSSLGSLGGSLGGLANMAGLNLGGGKRDNLQLALEVIKSKTFIYKIIDKNALDVEVFAAKSWDPISLKLEIDSEIYDVQNQKWVRKVKAPKSIIPSDFELYEEFRSNLSVSWDEKTNIVKVGYIHVSPYVAQKVVNIVINEINDMLQNKEIKEANVSIDLLREAITKTNYAEMRGLLYELVQEQTKRLLLAKTKEHYVFEPIDLPIVAENKHSPKRGLILIVFTFVYGLFVLLYLVIRPKLAK